MITNFDALARAVRAQFDEMALEPLFVVDAQPNEIWELYLRSFPPGTDPIFRERTEHNCACCRNFIRDLGGVVAVQNGALATIWDLSGLPEPYQPVADALGAFVRSRPIADIFASSEKVVGQALTREPVLESRLGYRNWHHFSVDIPRTHRVTDSLAERRSRARTSQQLLLRGIEQLSPTALDDVVELIDRGALYRGDEHRAACVAFRALQQRALALDPARRALLAWSECSNPAARFHNTVIGTLVQDLTGGRDLEAAVRAFESKVAPQNYKRPTALITKRMVDDAMKTIRDLDLEAALERRHARLEDVSVESVLFVDRQVRGRLRGAGGVEGALLEEVEAAATGWPPGKAQVENISVSDFIANVLPRAREVRLFLDNDKARNLMSLTAPVHAGVGRLFRWGNDFAWTYEGDAADSIRERVKRAGGRVEGAALRASLSWSNYDDLDLHARCVMWRGLGAATRGRLVEADHIFFSNRRGALSRGELDVDMNAGGGTTREPVENICWPDPLRDGDYEIAVHQFAQREKTNIGFQVEIEAAGRLESYQHDRAMRTGQNVPVALIKVRDGKVAEITPCADIVGGSLPREQWGLQTQRLHRVSAVVLSPNYWASADETVIGNLHWFFILEGCLNPAPARGIYNEFLRPDLAKHGRVFEVLGSKTKCPPSAEQMSGIGFSSTRRDDVVVVVAGAKSKRAYRVQF